MKTAMIAATTRIAIRLEKKIFIASRFPLAANLVEGSVDDGREHSYLRQQPALNAKIKFAEQCALCPTGPYWDMGEICLRSQRIICEPLDQRSREFTDALHQVWGIAEPFDLAYDRAADDRGIGKSPDLPHLFRS